MKNAVFIVALTLLLIMGCEQSKAPVEVQESDITALQKAGPKIVVPDDFATIQEAVDATADGTTIIVKKGIYRELVKIVDKNNITLIGKNAMLGYPEGATDPDKSIEIYGCSNITVRDLEFNGENNSGEYPLYCAIGYDFASGEVSGNIINGYHVGIACYNISSAPGVSGENLDLQLFNNKISEITGQGINLIGNYNARITNNSITCSEKYFEEGFLFLGIKMSGGTGTISNNTITHKKNAAYSPQYSIGIHLQMRDPAPGLDGLTNFLHNVDVKNCIIKGTDLGIQINGDYTLPDGEEWCVHGVRLLHNIFIRVVKKYDIYNTCEDIVIRP